MSGAGFVRRVCTGLTQARTRLRHYHTDASCSSLSCDEASRKDYSKQFTKQTGMFRETPFRQTHSIYLSLTNDRPDSVKLRSHWSSPEGRGEPEFRSNQTQSGTDRHSWLCKLFVSRSERFRLDFTHHTTPQDSCLRWGLKSEHLSPAVWLEN